MTNRVEVLIAGSDDFTLSMWHPAEDKQMKSMQQRTRILILLIKNVNLMKVLFYQKK